MNTKHIIWNKARGLPTVAHDDLQTALEEAKRLANLQPHDVFEVYSHAATVYGEVKVNVQTAGQSAAPLSPDVAPVKPEPTIDLRTCVKGQKLRLRNGEIAEYIGPLSPERPNLYLNSIARCLVDGFVNRDCTDKRDVIEILPLHYPHLRPVPPELLPLPEGAVYLGRSGEFLRTKELFSAWIIGGGYAQWSNVSHLNGQSTNCHYCAPADSEIVKLNREGGK